MIDGGPPISGLTAFILPSYAPGLARRKHDTLRHKGGDTGELFVDGVRVPASDRVGDEGKAFRLFDTAVALGRFHVASRSWAAAKAAFDITLEDARTRQRFGGRLIGLLSTRFVLALITIVLAVGRVHRSLPQVLPIRRVRDRRPCHAESMVV